MNDPAPHPYTTKSLAEHWECSDRHVRNMIQRGELHCFKLGHLVRIEQEEARRVERLNRTISNSKDADECCALTEAQEDEDKDRVRTAMLIVRAPK